MAPLPPPPPQTVMGVIFDLDGTMIASESLNWLAWDAVLRETCGPADCLSSTKPLITGPALRGASAPAVAAELIASRGIGAPHTVASLVAMKRSLAVELATGEGGADLANLWFDGVPAALHRLQAHLGAEGIGLCTSNLRPIAAAMLSAGGMECVFGGGRTVQEDVHASEMKPHPAPYVKALGKMKLEPGAVIAVEDSAAGVRSAVAAGVGAVIGVLNTEGDPAAEAAAAAATAALLDAGALWVFGTTVAAIEYAIGHAHKTKPTSKL
jgi:beta-phosphoglucomutase-like phosphatase (HAD superfamily)